MKERVVGYDSVDLAIIEEHYTIHFREGRKKLSRHGKGETFLKGEKTQHPKVQNLSKDLAFFLSLFLSLLRPHDKKFSLSINIFHLTSPFLFSLSLSLYNFNLLFSFFIISPVFKSLFYFVFFDSTWFPVKILPPDLSLWILEWRLCSQISFTPNQFMLLCSFSSSSKFKIIPRWPSSSSGLLSSFCLKLEETSQSFYLLLLVLLLALCHQVEIQKVGTKNGEQVWSESQVGEMPQVL